MNNKSVDSVENGQYVSEADAASLFLHIAPLLSGSSDYETAVATVDEEHIYRRLIRTMPSLPRQQFEL